MVWSFAANDIMSKYLYDKSSTSNNWGYNKFQTSHIFYENPDFNINFTREIIFRKPDLKGQNNWPNPPPL